MNSNRTKVRCRLSGAGYKPQHKVRDLQNKIGAVSLQRFLVPVQLPPQHSGQGLVIPDALPEDNGSGESDIATSDPDPFETVHEGESDADPMASGNLFKTLEPGPLLSQTHYECNLFMEDPLVSRTKMDPFHSSQPTH